MPNIITKFSDRIQETTNTTGSASSVVLAGATTGFLPFSSLPNNAVCHFLIKNPDNTWQIYEGAYTTASNELDRSSGWISSYDENIGNMDLQSGAEVSLVASAADFVEFQSRFNKLESGLLLKDFQYIGGAPATLYNRVNPRAFATDSATPAVGYISSDGNASAFKAILMAYQFGGTAGTIGDYAMWELSGVRNGAFGSISGQATITRLFATTGADLWTVAHSIDSIGMLITITGEADKSIAWAWQVSSIALQI